MVKTCIILYDNIKLYFLYSYIRTILQYLFTSTLFSIFHMGPSTTMELLSCHHFLKQNCIKFIRNKRMQEVYCIIGGKKIKYYYLLQNILLPFLINQMIFCSKIKKEKKWWRLYSPFVVDDHIFLEIFLTADDMYLG